MVDAVEKWPPCDLKSLERWLLDDLPVSRARLPVMKLRLDTAEALSHENTAAEPSRPDSPGDVVRGWIQEIPLLRVRIAAAERELALYSAAKSILDERERRLVELRYEERKSAAEVYTSLNVSDSHYYRVRNLALQKMLSFMTMNGKRGVKPEER